VDGQMDRCMDDWLDHRWMAGCMDEWMDEWMNGCMVSVNAQRNVIYYIRNVGPEGPKLSV